MLNQVSNVICHDQKFRGQISKVRNNVMPYLTGKKGLKFV